MKLLCLSIIACAVILSSCSDKLSRSKAEELIKKKYTFPYKTRGEIPKHFIIPSYLNWNWDNEGVIGDAWIKNINTMVAMKLVTLTGEMRTIPPGTYGAGYVTWFSDDVGLTAEGQKYYAGEGMHEFKFYGGNVKTTKVNLFDNEFDEITGIIEQQQPVHSAVVNYTVRRKNPTPFNDIFKEDLSKKESFTANFVKYDDGWRME